MISKTSILTMLICLMANCWGNMPEPYNSDTLNDPTTNSPQYYSQVGQDKFLYENFFTNKRGGIFVDIGAYDGIFFSNTYFFEKYLNWDGLCIEPNPEIFKQLKINRKCRSIEGCICVNSGLVPFLKINGRPEMLSGIISLYDPRHLERIEREVKLYGGSTEIIFAKCYSLTQLLLDNHLTKVDYLSLDTEGGELEILKSIDFNIIDIDVISVENNYGIDFNTFLESVGYEKIANCEWDEIYRKKT